MEVCADGFLHVRYPESGVEVLRDDRDVYMITEGMPLSAEVRCDRRFDVGHGEWRVSIRTVSSMTADADTFRLVDRLEAFEGDERVFEREWDRKYPRDHI
jgi:hypothetical protein